MALLTSYGANNRVVDSGLVVTYSKRLISGNWGYTSGNMSGYYNYMIELHRYARKSYRYVGMTYDAAISCRNAMITYYTRTVYQSEWNGNSANGSWNVVNGGTQVMADISVQHSDDNAWDVVINVNEDTCRYWKTPGDGGTTPYFNVMFSSERRWTYDGEGPEET